MEISQYVDRLRHQLALSAEMGGEETRALAERLAVPLESAVRLTLLEALSAAADEITRDLAPGSVDLRLRGGEPDFVVTPPPTAQSYESPVPPPTGTAGTDTTAGPLGGPSPAEPDEGTVSRINLRVPEQLKARIEEAAGRERLSVNAWLVRVVTAALADTHPRPAPDGRGSALGQRYTGWVR
ncbi:toxin-antitoxin system HicB family antitoxin [Plantactinospora sp. B5E13]|uniref:toxin-antitoxin system HicB family antitoxin n=1 Tax=unclassified Plantactinospora TaxID=2631981 RepID=UPI00325CC5CC